MAEQWSVDEAIDKFLSVKSASKRLSEATIKGYRNDLVAVSRFLVPELPEGHRVADISREVMRKAYLDWAADRPEGRAAASMERCWVAWNQLLTWCLDQDQLEKNPMRGVDRPKVPASHPKNVKTEGAIEKLEAAALSADKRDWRAWPERDVMLVKIFAGLFLRLEEAVELKIGSFYNPPQSRKVDVVGKGDKPRSIPVAAAVDEAVREYLVSRRSRFPKVPSGPGDPLLLDVNGQKMTRDQVRWRIKRLFDRAGIAPPKGALVHSLRHTGATDMAQSEARGETSLIELSEILGHASLNTTKGYTAGSGVRARRAVESTQAANSRRRAD